nr:YggS family pyridoxal phosphate-dependent enzyme [Thermoleptolyngbya sp. M55_K2018_002]
MGMSAAAPEAIAQTIHQIRQTLPNRVRLMAVTKQVSPDAMRAAYAAGIRDFGESRLQEAIAKQAELQDLSDVTWHLIGHLQSNKAAKVLDHFHWIHSVDSLKLAQRLNQLAGDRPTHPRVCLQVKILPDPNKFGWTVPELLADLPLLDDCQHLDIVGLMTIPPYGLDPDVTKSVFLQTRELAEKIRHQTLKTIRMEELSMGMSEDYPLAVEAGATIIRLGRVLFGERTET